MVVLPFLRMLVVIPEPLVVSAAKRITLPFPSFPGVYLSPPLEVSFIAANLAASASSIALYISLFSWGAT
jgi:hypothetical protein